MNAGNLTPYPSVTDKPLAKRPFCVKLEVDLDEKIRALPNPSEWVRAVLNKAMIDLEKGDDG